MITVELLSFIKKELSSGKTKEQIKGELLVGGGWKSEDIDEAFNNLNTPNTYNFSYKFYRSVAGVC